VTQFLLVVCLVSTIVAVLPSAIAQPRSEKSRSDAFTLNASLGRGINLGNALDAPTEGEWGVKLEAEYFQIIKAAGFRTVRIPVRWSGHASKDAPYVIDSGFLKRVDWAIDQAEANKLNVVLSMHHYDEMNKEPKKHLARLVGLWKQIAARYKDRPATLVFEVFNEPSDKLDEVWNDTIPIVLKAVRETNPTRAVIIGPGTWNNISALSKLRLPDDPNLIVTVHFYEPFKFTHQGASWVTNDDVKQLSGIRWEGSDAERAEMRKSFDEVADWAKTHNRPVFIGEFGAYEKADLPSRVRWSGAVVKQAETRGFSWAYWEFASNFGAYDLSKRGWRDPLLKVLQPK
jgi:endoglucanase